MIQQLFPDSIVCLEGNPNTIQGQMYPEEKAAVDGAVAWRIREFQAGRLLARDALSQLGIKDYPLLNDGNRVPIWPKGVVGSITHTREYCAVAVSTSPSIKGLGVDAEIISRLKMDLWEKICTPNEIHDLDSLNSDDAQKMATLIFSAKESFYKSQYRLSHMFVGFQDAETAIDTEGRTFTITLRKNIGKWFDKNQRFAGRFIIEKTFVITGLVL